MSSSSDSETNEKKKVLLALIRTRHLRYIRNSASIVIAQEIHKMNDEKLYDTFGIYHYQLLRLTALIGLKIRETHSKLHEMIRPRDRIIICLRFLASGSSFKDLGLHYGLPECTIQIIVLQTCDTILHELGPIVMPTPNRENWETVAKKFQKFYDFPTCLGSFNALQVNVGNIAVLDFLAIVDADCRFIMIDVGKYGLNKNMGKALKKSKLGKSFRRKMLDVPVDAWVDGYPERLPYVMIGGAGYPSTPFLLSKYKAAECKDSDTIKVFNCRITPPLRTAKEALNRLSQRWRIFKTPILVPELLVEEILRTTCCLHNYLSPPHTPAERGDYTHKMSPQSIELLQAAIIPSNSRRPTRYTFHKYFLSAAGQVPWQWEPLDMSWI